MKTAPGPSIMKMNEAVAINAREDIVVVNVKEYDAVAVKLEKGDNRP